jgi:fibronectin type 3 domain-containing protein
MRTFIANRSNVLLRFIFGLLCVMTVNAYGEEQVVCTETGGTIAILVDPSLVNGIRSGLNQFEIDLCNENYTVIEMQYNFTSPPEVRDYLLDLYIRTQQCLVGTILIGHIPYAYQFVTLYPTNPNIPSSSEEVISFQYYADLNGTFQASPSYVSPKGHPYSYDVHSGNVDWEIWVGVLPFYKGELGKTVEALNRYFIKNHTYRTGGCTLPCGFLEVDEFYVANTIEEYTYYLNALRSGTYAWTPFSDDPNARLYFDSPPAGLSVDGGYADLSADVVDFTVLDAHGSWGGSGKLSISWVENHRIGTTFLWSNGCAVGNLDYPDNFLTSVLYSPTSDVLVAKGTTNNSGGMGNNANGFFGHNIATALSEGKTFGQAILSHVNVPLVWPWSESREFHYATSVVLGDSTLTYRYPETPSNPSPSDGATGISTTLTMSWSSCTNTDSYDIYFGTSSNPPYVSNTTSTSYSLSGLTLGETYHWKIIAKSNCGSSAAGSVWSFTTSSETVSTPAILSGPSQGIIGSSYTYETGGSASSLSHPVQYFFDWGGGTNSDWLPVGQTSASKSWTSAGTYNVKVQARCSTHTSVVSNWSGTLKVTINYPAAPSPPTNVQASDGTYMDKVQVTWSASPGADSYTVYRATSTSRRATKVTIGTTTNTTYDDTSASVMVIYFYCVVATNSYGKSAYSTYDTGYRSDGTPPIPSNVAASDGTYMDKVQVTWSASLWATSYTIYRATSSKTRASKTSLGSTSETFFNDTTAVPKTTYYYYVKASNVSGTSGFSSYDTGYRSDGTPPIPSNVAASDGTYMDKVQVTWSASPGADSYTVYRATSTSRRATKVTIGTTTNTTYDDTSASVMVIYFYCVVATNSYGTSGFSAYDTGYR